MAESIIELKKTINKSLDYIAEIEKAIAKLRDLLVMSILIETNLLMGQINSIKLLKKVF